MANIIKNNQNIRILSIALEQNLHNSRYYWIEIILTLYIIIKQLIKNSIKIYITVLTIIEINLLETVLFMFSWK